jgi:hypothetical protein
MTDLLPRIVAQSKDLPAMFEKIDQLEVSSTYTLLSSIILIKPIIMQYDNSFL